MRDRRRSAALLGGTLAIASIVACGTLGEGVLSESYDGGSDREATDAEPADASAVSPIADAADSSPMVHDTGTDATDMPSDPDAEVDAGTSPLSDGQCVPRNPNPSVFDPDCIYLVGTLHEGLAGYDVLGVIGDPTAVWAGFELWDSSRAKIRPTDGALLYTELTGPLRTFVADPITIVAPGLPQPYPAMPFDNDPATLAPKCAPGAAVALGGVFPDDGRAMYGCYVDAFNTGAFLDDPAATQVTLPFGMIALGPGRTVLGITTAGLAVGPLGGPASANTSLHLDVQAARYAGGGAFWVYGLRPEGQLDHAEEWRIEADGSTTRLGEMALPTDGYAVPMTPAIGPDGDVYAIVTPKSFVDAVVRYHFAGGGVTEQLVYEESQGPVRIHGGRLITGP